MTAARLGLFLLLASVLGYIACDVFVPNLHQACLRCLCKASSGCNLTQGCEGGYCGPFALSRIYWADAGRPVLPDDDPDRRESFQDCARVYGCAKRVVKAYMAKYAKDCNGDGSINCDDYAMIHHNGGFSCGNPLSANFAKVYYGCRPPLTAATEFTKTIKGKPLLIYNGYQYIVDYTNKDELTYYRVDFKKKEAFLISNSG